MKKKVHFYCSLYGINYYFVRSSNIMDCQSYHDEDIINTGQHGFCLEVDNEDKHGILVWVNDKHQELIPNLVHEAIHAASFVFKSRGIKFSLTNDEPFAYYVQWIFENCYKNIPRVRK